MVKGLTDWLASWFSQQGTKFHFFVFTIPDTEISKNVPADITNYQNRFIIFITNDSDFLTWHFSEP